MRRVVQLRMVVGAGLLMAGAVSPAVGCSGTGSESAAGVGSDLGLPGEEQQPGALADAPLDEVSGPPEEGAANRFEQDALGSEPSQVLGSASAPAAGFEEDVAAGSNHTLFLNASGAVRAWGQNTYGQLGTGSASTTPQGTPVQIPGLPAIKAIAAGAYHSLAIDTAGHVWAWGQNTYGQLGTGSASTTPQGTPVQIAGLPPIKAIAAGVSHSLAIDTSGVIWVWGNNSYGQLGTGVSGNNQATPSGVAVTGGAVAIAAGWHHSLAVSTNGSVWSWGRNNYGQIGNGASGAANRTTPYQVSLGGAASTVVAGGAHSLALLTDGTLKGWGYHGQGQLGLGSFAAATQPLPQVVPGLSGITRIAAGGYYSLAMNGSGAAWSWGQDAQGQLGDGDASTANRTSPYALQGLNALAIAAGAYHVAALSADCWVWTWGSNNTAQLGGGASDSNRHPAPASILAWTRQPYFDGDMDGYGDPLQPAPATCLMPPGYVANSADCDDFDPGVFPGAPELCNGLDDNCSAGVDEGNPEGGDPCDTGLAGECAFGELSCTGGALLCVPDQPATSEVCDGLDNDCDNTVDEGVKITFYRDADSDTFGTPNQSTQGCGAPNGYVANSSDCNDANPSIKPGATEVCNGVDDNCAGGIDEGVKNTYYRDLDSDTFGNPGQSTQACSAPAGYVTNSSDCNDTSASIKPGATEVCNGVDDNCAGGIDEGVKNTYYRDLDSDTFGNPNQSTQACSAPAGYVTSSSDCNDTSASIKPGATEVCNGVDDNCANGIDEGVKTTFYRDADGDGYGTPSQTTSACSTPSGYVSNSADCNDGNASIKPGATEVWNSVDDDCDGSIDDGVCHPSWKSHGQVWIGQTAYTYYQFRDEWCCVGSSCPAQCWSGTYIYDQNITSTSCVSYGSGASCLSDDALWYVTCDALVECIYNCNGECVPTTC